MQKGEQNINLALKYQIKISEHKIIDICINNPVDHLH